VNDELFENLPLLLAVPQAAQILGITRASAYRRPSESWVQREGQTLSIDRFCLLYDT
jgi:hypothetical protein